MELQRPLCLCLLPEVSYSPAFPAILLLHHGWCASCWLGQLLLSILRVYCRTLGSFTNEVRNGWPDKRPTIHTPIKNYSYEQKGHHESAKGRPPGIEPGTTRISRHKRRVPKRVSYH
ncbi:hypothetical protein DOTSEDRAFT_72051 [Dothistroma septosporum NZE10]|uniref:Uncharacterized protein n=1 Tax=Dothistroma septosporum (strain NZE10 / CBS 128990) TaxID=675120 RepID=N1PPY6_DOTSN|nr:hypothetical protein DOTSEDRAFT_72051 [Dothistroma septosporum NZE10]